MPSPINKKTLAHLADLAKLDLTEREKEKLLPDLKKILGHFEELRKVDTSNVEPVTGGTDLKNCFRDDGERADTLAKKGAEDFPKKENGLNKVPSIFNND